MYVLGEASASPGGVCVSHASAAEPELCCMGVGLGVWHGTIHQPLLHPMQAQCQQTHAHPSFARLPKYLIKHLHPDPCNPCCLPLAPSPCQAHVTPTQPWGCLPRIQPQAPTLHPLQHDRLGPLPGCPPHKAATTPPLPQPLLWQTVLHLVWLPSALGAVPPASRSWVVSACLRPRRQQRGAPAVTMAPLHRGIADVTRLGEWW